MLFQLLIINRMQPCIVINSKGCCRSCRVPQNQEDRLHSDGAECYMGSAYAYRDKQVAAFLFLRNNCPVANGVGACNRCFHISLILNIAIYINIALHMM